MPNASSRHKTALRFSGNDFRDVDVYLRASAFVPRTWSYLAGRLVTGMAPDMYFTRNLEIQ